MSEIESPPASVTPHDQVTSRPSPSRPPLHLERADEIISHLSRIFATPAGTDTLLLTIGYTSLLASSVLSSLGRLNLRKTARIISSSVILHRQTSILVLSGANISSSYLLILAARLKALSSLIGDVRIFTRLWGLLRIWGWGKEALVYCPERGVLLRGVEGLQVLANVVYQSLENIAYLSGKGVMELSPDKQKKAWTWSSRFWALHVALDFVRLYRKWVLEKEKGKEQEKEGMKTHEVADDLKGQVFINTLYAPLTVHWSLENGLINEFCVGILGSIIGILKTRQIWKNSS